MTHNFYTKALTKLLLQLFLVLTANCSAASSVEVEFTVIQLGINCVYVSIVSVKLTGCWSIC